MKGKQDIAYFEGFLIFSHHLVPRAREGGVTVDVVKCCASSPMSTQRPHSLQALLTVRWFHQGSRSWEMNKGDAQSQCKRVLFGSVPTAMRPLSKPSKITNLNPQQKRRSVRITPKFIRLTLR